MNILFLTRKDLKHPSAGWAEVVIHQYMTWLIERWHSVTQVTPFFDWAKKNEVADGVNIIRVYSIHTIYFCIRYYYLAKLRGKYDIIVDHAGGIPLMSPLYIWNKKILLFIHHIGDQERKEYFSQWISMWWIGTIFRFVYRVFLIWLYRHKTTITVSNGTAQELKKIWFDDVYVLPNISGYPLLSLSWTVSKKNILTMVWRMVPNKQFSHAIKLLYRLHCQGLMYVLNIIGNIQDISEKRKLDIMIWEYKLWDYVTFHGKMTTTQIIAIRDTTKYGLMLSKKEWFGMTILDANMRAVPVIGYDIPWVNEVICNNINWYLVQKNDIDSLISCIIDREDNYQLLVQSTYTYISSYPDRSDNNNQFEKILLH
jgi:glycosyltransferase involved in cell wall biosynthesis